MPDTIHKIRRELEPLAPHDGFLRFRSSTARSASARDRASAVYEIALADLGGLITAVADRLSKAGAEPEQAILEKAISSPSSDGPRAYEAAQHVAEFLGRGEQRHVAVARRHCHVEGGVR
jgi:hypothetical protein